MNECKSMSAQEQIIHKIISNEIAHNLTIIELANFSANQVEIVKKMLWKMHNDTVKLMNDCKNDKSNKSN